VSQEKREVQIYRRQEQGWDLEVFLDQDTVRFESIRLDLALTEVYRGVSA